MQQAQAEEGAEIRKGREGNRWVNERPRASEVVDWFATVKLHDGLRHEDFIGGITLIQEQEKSHVVVGFDVDGRPMIAERTNLAYIPYAKVDARVAYFWALMDLHEDWLGIIEPAVINGPAGDGLPPGFFRHQVKSGDRTADYIGCSMQVRILQRHTVEWRDGYDGRILEGQPIRQFPTGTKVMPVANRYDIDHHALARAETGAVGRALGMAGMLVIPGSGVASSEDVEDLASAGVTAGREPAAPPPDVAPPVVKDADQLRERIADLLAALEDHPEQLQFFRDWAKERAFGPFEGLEAPALKGIARKLEKELDTARSKEILAAKSNPAKVEKLRPVPAHALSPEQDPPTPEAA